MNRWRVISGTITALALVGCIWYLQSSRKNEATETVVDLEKVPVVLQTAEPDPVAVKEADAKRPRVLASVQPGVSFSVLHLPMLHPVVEQMASLGIVGKSMDETVRDLEALGISVSRTVAGTKEFGERYELRASHPARGLQSLLLIYQIEDGQPVFERSIVGVRPEPGAFEHFRDLVQASLGEGGKPIEGTPEGVLRYEFGDDRVLWMKEFTENDPHSGTFPETVLLTLEPIME